MESLVATLRREIEVVIAAQEFGYVNDVRMAPKLVEVQKQSNGGIDAARAASYAVGHHEAQAAPSVAQRRGSLGRLETHPALLGLAD
jgi:hypothetical protein